MCRFQPWGAQEPMSAWWYNDGMRTIHSGTAHVLVIVMCVFDPGGEWRSDYAVRRRQGSLWWNRWDGFEIRRVTHEYTVHGCVLVVTYSCSAFAMAHPFSTVFVRIFSNEGDWQCKRGHCTMWINGKCPLTQSSSSVWVMALGLTLRRGTVDVFTHSW